MSQAQHWLNDVTADARGAPPSQAPMRELERTGRAGKGARFLNDALAFLLAATCAGHAQSSGIFRQVYSGIAGNSLSSLTNHPSYPNSPSSTNLLTSSFETSRDSADNYGQRLRALLVPPTTGSYVFWIASDDQSVLYLSSDESAFNKTTIARVNSNTSYRQWTKETNQQSAAISLIAGRRYYLEALHKEGTGGDHLSLRWRLPGGTIEEPIPASRCRPFGWPPSIPPTINRQPTNVVVNENAPALFSVALTNLDEVSYQWQRQGTNVPGARGASYTLPATRTNDHGAVFRCVITNTLGTTFSSSVTLSVIPDRTAPALLSAANLSSNSIWVVFSEPVEPLSAANLTNYALTPAAPIQSATMSGSSQTVLLSTGPLPRGSNYILSVSRVRDRAAASNPIAPNSQTSFSVQLKGVYREVFSGLGGSSVFDLTNHPSFPAAPTSGLLLTNGCAAPSDALDSYGQRLRALLLPPVTGTYLFWISADEAATLLLATNDSAVAASPIASVTSATVPGQWDGQTSQQSALMPLVAGQACYLEVLMKEGIGSDHLAVRWRWPAGFIEEPIAAAWLVPFGLSPPIISEHPTNLMAIENLPAVFRVAVSNVDPISFQWQRHDTNIAGATNALYTNASVVWSDHGSIYRCLAWNALGATQSAPAILSVAPDVTPPVILQVLNEGPARVIVFFSEPLDPVSAAAVSNYGVAGINLLSAVLRPDGRSVALTTSRLVFGADYLLTVNRVRDRAATPNVIGANSLSAFRACEFFPEGIQMANPLDGFAQVPDGFNLSAAGSDIGGTNDQFQFSQQQRAGDFDVRVRVQRLQGLDLWTKLGLIAREDLSPGSRHAGVLATPALAGLFFQWRHTNNAVAQTTGFLPANGPHTWLRLKRAVNEFTGFASYDGQTWTRLGTTNLNMPAAIYLGFALASHVAGQAVAAEVRDFGDVSGGAVGTPRLEVEPPGPSSRRTGLVISEIMYHPAERSDGRSGEFIELLNSNPYYEDLSGYRISGAVDFVFPPGSLLAGGAYLVVGRNAADLQALTGITNIIGSYSNNLPNDAATIRLRNRADAVLLEIEYSARPPWPVAADGTGHSLVLARPSRGENNPAAWGPSEIIGGSPGRSEALSFEPQRNVLINEFLAQTDLPQVDYLELYNHSHLPVDISGCWLSDDPATNKFRIPDATTLGPRGFVVFDQTQLGFALSSAGERLFLVDSNRTRVLDALQFEGQENGVSTGRSPDGAPSFYRLATPTPGTANAARRPSDVVINEIMYHPASGLEDDEYVELFNRGTSPYDLGGWRFTDGIDYTLPPGTFLPVGGYLVVARNAARLLTNYAQLNAANTLGNFEGSLRNSGERLALSKPDFIVSTNASGDRITNIFYIVIDEVTYGTGGAWGQWSDGGGSSLELIDSRADRRLASNWADSDETAKGVWTQVTTTDWLNHSQGTNWDSLQIYLHDAGECFVDDVQVRVAGSSNLVPNSTFEAGLIHWFAQGNHSLSGLAANGYQSSRSLHLRASMRGDTLANRVRTALTSTYSNNVYATITARVRWLRGRPEVLFRLRGNHMELPATMFLPANLGTPGMRNTRASVNASAAISEVSHWPVLPAAGEGVTVRARVQDPDGVAAVQLVYRLDPLGAPITLAMLDSGTGGDAVAADGEYGAAIPGQTNGALVAFYVEAHDGFVPASVARFPANAATRECLVRFGETQPNGSFGTYRFWLTQSNFNRWLARERLSNEPIDGSFVCGNYRVIYLAGNRYAGSPYHSPSYNSPTGNNCDYTITLPVDDALLAETQFTLQQPGNGGNDPTCQRELTAYWIASELGIPFLYRRQVHLFVNGVRRGILFDDTQQPDGDFMKQWYPDDPDGDLYKIMVWFEMNDASTSFTSAGASLNVFTNIAGGKKLARYRQNFGKRAFHDSASNYTNLFDLVDTLNSPATGAVYTARTLDTVNVNQWSRVLAVERLIGNGDSYSNGGGQNMYTYKPTRRPWELLLWDIDFAFNSAPPTSSMFTFTDPPITRLFSDPAVRRVYWQALEDAVNGPLAPSAAERINARAAAYLATGLNAASSANTMNYLNTRREYLLSLFPAVRAPFAITNHGGADFTHPDTVITLGGLAPVSVRRVTINGTEYPLSWSTITNWTVRVALAARTNLLVVQGYDAKGNEISSARARLTIYLPITPDAAEDSLTISEIMVNPAVSNASYVELFNRSATTTFDLWNYRLDGVGFTFPAGALIAPRSHSLIVGDLAAFQLAHGPPAALAGVFDGRLRPEGETLTLIRRGSIPGDNHLIDQVKYEPVAPWPPTAAMPASGASLQLIDPAQDNARVSNWGDGHGWRFFSYTGKPLTNRLLLFLDLAGDLYLDDLRVVSGTVAEEGTNLVTNGDFEAPLTEGWGFVGVAGTNSTISSTRARCGTNSLHLIFTAPGAPTAHLFYTIANLVVTNFHTLSFWYFTTTNANTLTARFSSIFRPVVNIRAAVPSPGMSNLVASTVEPYPLLWINEVQPENPDGMLPGPAGPPPPWIELFNSGTNYVSLDGLFLSSNYTNLQQWAFPTGALIGPSEFRLVFADGQPELSTGGVWHTSFGLLPTNGAVVLSRGAQILDYINYHAVSAGLSYGAWPDGQLFGRQLFYRTTPGQSNNPAPLPVAINEWLASNTRTLINPATGHYDDWFELYNYGDIPLDLSGHFLTDDLASPAKWPIPNATALAPRSFLLVWADNDATLTNRIGQALHTSFALSRRGDEIGFFAPGGLLVDGVRFGEQASDVSQGRYPNGHLAGGLHFMTTPTPGESNIITNNLFAPVLVPIGDRAAVEGELLSFICTASDQDEPAQTLTYSLIAGAPYGASVEPSTGVFTWTPHETHGGAIHAIGVRVTDNGAPPLSDTNLFMVEVLKTNSPPVFGFISDEQADELVSFSRTIIATDLDLPLQGVTYQLLGGPPGLVLNPAGQLDWTPDEAQGPGTYPVTVAATDDGLPPLSATQSFVLVVREVNQAPALGPLPDRVVHANAPLRLTCEATDADLPANALTFALAQGPADSTLDPMTGAFAWTPPGELAGTTNEISVMVSDSSSGGPSLSDQRTFWVTVLRSLNFRSVHRSGNAVELTWETALGGRYRLQATDSLDNPLWQDIGSEIIARGNSETVRENVSGRQRFYRVVIPE